MAPNKEMCGTVIKTMVKEKESRNQRAQLKCDFLDSSQREKEICSIYFYQIKGNRAII